MKLQLQMFVYDRVDETTATNVCTETTDRVDETTATMFVYDMVDETTATNVCIGQG